MSKRRKKYGPYVTTGRQDDDRDILLYRLYDGDEDAIEEYIELERYEFRKEWFVYSTENE